MSGFSPIQLVGPYLGGTPVAPTVLVTEDSKGFTGPSTAEDLSGYAFPGVYRRSYAAKLHTTDNALHTIFSFPVAKLRNYSLIEIDVRYAVRGNSTTDVTFAHRFARFKVEAGTLTQVDTTQTIGTDATNTDVMTYTIAVVASAIVVQSTCTTGNAEDVSAFIDMFYAPLGA